MICILLLKFKIAGIAALAACKHFKTKFLHFNYFLVYYILYICPIQ